MPFDLDYYDALRVQLRKCERCSHVNEMCGNVASGEETLHDLDMRLRKFCRLYVSKANQKDESRKKRLSLFPARV